MVQHPYTVILKMSMVSIIYSISILSMSQCEVLSSLCPSGDLHEEEVWPDEEGLRAERTM